MSQPPSTIRPSQPPCIIRPTPAAPQYHAAPSGRGDLDEEAGVAVGAARGRHHRADHGGRVGVGVGGGRGGRVLPVHDHRHRLRAPGPWCSPTP
eukprot:2624303-Rhodomonas_salina.1